MSSTTNPPFAANGATTVLPNTVVEPLIASNTAIVAVPRAIPVPRRQALETMQGLTLALGGGAMPLRCAETNETAGYRLGRLGLTMLGTGCRRPLLCEEAQDLRETCGDHILIVRTEDDAHGFGPFTVDLLMPDAQIWLLRYRMWQIHPTADLWFVPSQGEGRSLRVVSGCLAMSPRAPFFNLFEREHGFNVAARTLAAQQQEAM